MVNGPVVHTGGVINTGSPTVFIGGAMAARMGDQSHCLTVGAAGAGVPQQVGPGLADEVSSSSTAGDRNARGWQGPGFEHRYRDTDQDGTYDMAEIAVTIFKKLSAVFGHHPGCVD